VTEFDLVRSQVEKAAWGDGPWQNEPDRLEWEYEGLHCAILRQKFGHLCGYVGVPRDHPDYGKFYNDVDLKVHGGLTYSENHLFKNRPDEDKWWFGFDCAHAYDLQPGMAAFLKFVGNPFPTFEGLVYRDIHYVKTHVEDLASQLNEREG